MPFVLYADNFPVEESIRLKGEGLSFTEISKIIGVDRRIIGQFFKDKAIAEAGDGPVEYVCRPTQPHQINNGSGKAKITDSDKLKIYKMKMSGKSMREIASTMGVNFSTIEYHLNKMKQKKTAEVKESPKPEPKKDIVRDEFIAMAVNAAVVRSKVKLHTPDCVTRMKLSLMSRGFNEMNALSQAMNFYARGKVTSADDDYQPRKLVMRRRA
jgi:transposase